MPKTKRSNGKSDKNDGDEPEIFVVPSSSTESQQDEKEEEEENDGVENVQEEYVRDTDEEEEEEKAAEGKAGNNTNRRGRNEKLEVQKKVYRRKGKKGDENRENEAKKSKQSESENLKIYMRKKKVKNGREKEEEEQNVAKTAKREKDNTEKKMKEKNEKGRIGKNAKSNGDSTRGCKIENKKKKNEEEGGQKVAKKAKSNGDSSCGGKNENKKKKREEEGGQKVAKKAKSNGDSSRGSENEKEESKKKKKRAEEGEGGGGGGGGQEEEGNLKKKKKKISDVQLANRMQKSDGELADRLQKSLKGRRYLIVVDDIWSTEAWDEFRLWFPEYNNRSRILLTTRDIKVAQYASYPRDPSPMRFLKPEESWTLFCQKAFDQKVCPIEFENIAREVVKNCNGLPLMISVVAGALSSKRTVDEWRKVAQSVSLLVNLDDYQRCSRVLALSYNHLPSHLKACFLYFGVFPKASEISVKKLIRLWVAEGFLELKGFEGLEKVATSLLSNLIDKSLVVVGKRSLNDKIKTCRIHDLLHDFCLREAENENLLYVTETPVSTYEGSRKVSSQVRRWVSVYPKDGRFSPIHFNCRKTRSLLVYSYITEHSRSKLGLDHFKRLRVLQLEKSWYEFPSEVVHLVALRYLSVKVSRSPQDLPIFNLMNLQTFIFPQNMPEYQEVIYLPSEIWEMSQLRHLRSTRMYLYSPPPMVSDNEVKYRALENLQSVCGLIPGCCTKEIFEGIKKVKKLGIYGTKDDFNSEPRCLENLMDLHELEALTIVSYRKFNSNTFLSLPCPGSFPPNLKKLTLCCTFLLWKDMTIVSMLPKLEVLQLRNNAFVPNIGWKVTEMQFPKLKFLLLEQLNIKYWRATDDCFPCLERIIIRNCRFLIEIPQEFADSMTLQLIELHQCYPSLVNSAELIQKEQLESLGNNMLKVYAFDTIKWRIWEE